MKTIRIADLPPAVAQRIQWEADHDPADVPDETRSRTLAIADYCRLHHVAEIDLDETDELHALALYA